MTLEDLIKEYLETLDGSYQDEYYADDKWIHTQGLVGFLDWLKSTDYEIIIKK